MPNKTYAAERLQLANRNLETARLLLRENHFTDSIAIEIQQTIEKTFKAVYAFYGISIPKTHSLPVLYNFVSEKISIEDLYIDDLIVISDYYETDRYPGPRYVMPTRSEVEHFFLLTERLSKYIKQIVFDIAARLHHAAIKSLTPDPSPKELRIILKSRAERFSTLFYFLY